MKIRFMVALAVAGMIGTGTAVPPAAASSSVAAQPRHCVANVDTGHVACASGPDRAIQLSDVGATSLVIARFYDGTGYTGATFTWYQSRECTASYDNEWQWDNLGELGWNNRVSSIHTYNRCDVKLYDGYYFTGASSVWIDQSSNLSYIGSGWNNRASSVKFS